MRKLYVQDWNYHWYHDIDLTVELSDSKWPDASQLPQFWEDNRASLVWYLSQARSGVHGFVSDAATKEPVKAEVRVPSLGKSVVCGSQGDYHRLLLPGTYTLQFSAPGYNAVSKNVTVAPDKAIMLDVELTPVK